MRRARHWVAAVVVALLATLSPIGTSRATTDQDLPGAPIPESGLLEANVGGQIVDRVYQLEVPAASVLVITLRGEPGAELGLYVFGSGITSILTAQPLASSAKPGNAQAVSIRFIRASTIYVNVNGRNIDRPYAFTLRASSIVDSTPPLIREITAPPRSRSTHVCLQIRSTDPISGVVAVAMSESQHGGFEQWELFSGFGTYCREVAPGEGRRTLYVRVKNGVDLESSTYEVSTIIDDTAPSIRAFQPVDALLISPLGALAWQFSEAVFPSGRLNGLVRVYRQDGAEVLGTISRNTTRTRYSWAPRANIAPATVLMVTLGSVRDLAGNVMEFPDARMVTRKQATWGRVMLVGTNRSLRIQITVPRPLVGKNANLEQKTPRGWSRVSTISIPSNSFSIRLPQAAGPRLRISFSGTDTLAPMTSNVIRVPN